MKKIVAIIGAGYVGMRIGLKFAQSGFKVIAFDNNEKRIEELKKGKDRNKDTHHFKRANIMFTHDLALLSSVRYFIVTVSSPIDKHLSPDLTALISATETIGLKLKKNDLVIFESTVFPGATEELLIPILEEKSTLKSGIDFHVGYSPERIAPGNNEHGLEKDIKVISAQNKTALKKVKLLYQHLSIDLYCAPSIKVAESCKLLENIQRDVNIALMNEYAQIMNKMGIPFYDVLSAAKTKWNFLLFSPGLVGGHCIPVDPYYLIYQANKHQAKTDLISKARQINEELPHYICDSLIKLLSQQGFATQGAKVVLLGISYKPDVVDTRHSLTIELYKMLKQYNIEVSGCDPLIDQKKLPMNLIDWKDISLSHGLILIQAHAFFLKKGFKKLCSKLEKNGVFMDISGAFAGKVHQCSDQIYWVL